MAGRAAPPTADISPNITAINFPVNQHIAALLHAMSLSTLVYSYKHFVAVFPKSNESRDDSKNLTYFSPSLLAQKVKSELEL